MATQILIYSALAGAATMAGILLLRLNEKKALKYSHFLNSFAAGVILAVAFFHQLPTAIELASVETAMLLVAAGLRLRRRHA